MEFNILKLFTSFHVKIAKEGYASSRRVVKKVRAGKLKTRSEKLKESGAVYKLKIINSIKSNEDGNNKPEYKEIKLISSSFKLSYEAILVFFSLEGQTKNFLLFILVYCMNLDGTFHWNNLVAEQYADLCETATGKRPSLAVIRKAHSALVSNLLIQKKETGIYMVNPILYPGSTSYNRKDLLNAYGKIGGDKGKTTMECLFEK